MTMLRGETIINKILLHRETKMTENKQIVADIYSRSEMATTELWMFFAATFVGQQRCSS